MQHQPQKNWQNKYSHAHNVNNWGEKGNSRRYITRQNQVNNKTVVNTRSHIISQDIAERLCFWIHVIHRRIGHFELCSIGASKWLRSYILIFKGCDVRVASAKPPSPSPIPNYAFRDKFGFGRTGNKIAPGLAIKQFCTYVPLLYWKIIMSRSFGVFSKPRNIWFSNLSFLWYCELAVFPWEQPACPTTHFMLYK